MKYLVVIALLFSCAHQKTHKKQEQIDNLGSILTLSKASYIRGCIEGMNYLIPKKTKGKRLKFCTGSGEKHRLDMKEIMAGPKTHH